MLSRASSCRPPVPLKVYNPLPQHVLMISLCVQNKSTVVSSTEEALSALKTQLNNDFSPVWNIEATLQCPGWNVYILDDTDVAGALGYHDVDPNGVPYAKVFARTAQQFNTPWTSVLSHETMEMLVDPYGVQTAADAGSNWFAKFYLMEVADPVEDYTYTVDNVAVSDFVYPTYFVPGEAGPYDKLGVVGSPLTLPPGGYQILYQSILGAGWQYILGEKKKKPKCAKPTLHKRLLSFHHL